MNYVAVKLDRGEVAIDQGEVTIEDVRGHATVSVPTAARLLGIGRNQAYDAVHAGVIPSIQIGTRLLVPVPKLLALLGVE